MTSNKNSIADFVLFS